MSNHPREPDPQEWPTYPGGPGGNDASGSQQRPYASPSGQDDDAYRAYQDYLRQQQEYHPPHRASMHPSSPPAAQTSQSSSLNRTWLYIALGAVAVLVITGVARGGNWWGFIIFAGIAWWIWNRRKR